MEIVNNEKMDSVLSSTLIEEIGLPIDISNEWQQLLEKEPGMENRILWLSENVLRLTAEEFLMMYESLLIYQIIQVNKDIPLENILKLDFTSDLLFVYFKRMYKILEGEEPCDSL